MITSFDHGSEWTGCSAEVVDELSVEVHKPQETL